jgi:hypothetical protein
LPAQELAAVPDEFGGDQEQLEELNFEGQQAAAQSEDTAAAAPEPVQAEPGEDELEEDDWTRYETGAYELEGQKGQVLAELAAAGQLSEEDLAEWAEVDPVSYAGFLAQLQVGQYVQELEARLEPVVASVHQAQGRYLHDEVRNQVGEDVFERNKERVAELIASQPDAFMTRDGVSQENLLRAFQAVEYEQAQAARQAYNRGDDVKEAMDAVSMERDAFGGGRRVVQSADGQVALEVPAHMTRAQAQAAVEKKASEQAAVRSTVHVEGGSGPQPQFRDESLDPVVAEMEAHSGQRDAFGHMPGHGR